MINYLEKIFQESNIVEKEINDKQSFFSLDNVSYYFTIELEWNEFTNCKRYSDFESLPNYQELKEAFDQIESKGESNVIEKNSSLIVLVKAPSLETIEEYYQQVLLLEEDEFFLKKYVILYSEKSVSEFPKETDLIPYLETKVANDENFNNYMTNGHSEELEEYLLILQLFTKLPFLTLSLEGITFKALEERLQDKLGHSNSGIYDKLINEQSLITSIDFTDEDNEQEMDQLLKLLENDKT